jgi:GTP-binding protein
LLNALAGRRIAKVSGTPGKTQAMNVYCMPRAEPVGAQHAGPLHHASYYFLDLPGYGWARASQRDRAAFRRLITQALDRSSLTGVLWLLDARRDPSDEDRDIQDQFAAGGTRIRAAITKSDKLPRGLLLRRERELRALLQLDQDQTIVTSARTGTGIAELREAVAELVRKAAE